MGLRTNGFAFWIACDYCDRKAPRADVKLGEGWLAPAQRALELAADSGDYFEPMTDEEGSWICVHCRIATREKLRRYQDYFDMAAEQGKDVADEHFKELLDVARGD